MFFKTNLIAGLIALSLFGLAQVRGWNLFEREAAAQTAASASRGPGGHISHK